MLATDIRLLQLFLPDRALTGLDLVRKGRLARGLVHVRCHRLCERGYLTIVWLPGAAPRRYFYSLTDEGRRVAETGYLYDVEGRKARMARLLSMNAPSSIIRGEAWLLLYGYAGGRWRAVWWAFVEALRHSTQRWRDRLFGPPAWLAEFDELVDDEGA